MIGLLDSVALIILVLSWWVAISSYPRLPDSIPVHFGVTGDADRWGGRWMIFLTPAIATTIIAVDWFIFTRLSGTSRMPATLLLPLHLLLLELTLLFTYVTWRMTEVAFGRAKGLGLWFLPVVLLAVFSTSAWMIVAGKTH
jgi:hypothetical protein